MIISSIKDRFFGLEYFGVFQDLSIPKISPLIILLPAHAVCIEFYTPLGGVKKMWYSTQVSDNLIDTLAVELTFRGCGVCNITFSQLVFPIDGGDIIVIKYLGKTIYRGIVDNDVDLSVPEVTTTPYWKRFGECMYTKTYSAATSVLTILQTLITELSSDTGVTWNLSKVHVAEIGTAIPTMSVTYTDERVDDILDDLLKILGESYYWGVDIENEFYVKRYKDSGNTDYRLYSMDKAIFESVEITCDYSKVDMTEAIVYKRSSSGGSAVRVGTVGNTGNTSYPPLDIANKVRRKVGKLTASQYLDDTTSLIWAYETLKSQSRRIDTAEINGLDTTVYVPEIGHRLLVEDGFKASIEDIIDCSVSTGWANATPISGVGRDNGYGIQLFSSSEDDALYDFGRDICYYHQRKIGMFFRGPEDTLITIVFVTNESTETSFSFSLPNGVLCYRDFDIKTEFRYIRFEYISTATPVYVSGIVAFCDTKKQVILPVNKIKYSWSSKGADCNVTCGDLTNLETKELEDLMKKVRKLEYINS